MAGEKKPEKKKTRAELVGEMIAKVEERINNNEFKGTVADYVRLIELEKELAVETKRDVRLKWVDPAAATNNER